MKARLLAITVVVAGAVLAAAPAAHAASEAPPADDEAVAARSAADAATSTAVGHLVERVGESIGPPGGEVRSLVLSPSDPQRLYLGGANGHVYVSRDAAESWHESGIELPHNAVVDNIAVGPRDADLVYAAYWRPDGSGGLLRSRDGGASWQRLDALGSRSLRALALAPSAPETLYAGGLEGIWRSDDGGETWDFAGGDGAPFQFVESLAVDPRDPDRVYAGTWRQAYRSVDGGRSWQRIHRGMAIDRDVFSIAISPHDPDRLVAGTCYFIYDSGNGGDAWTERRQGLATVHPRVHVVLPDPRDPDIVWAGTRGALYRSGDGGRTWEVVHGAVSVSAIAVEPESGRVYLGTEEVGVLVSENGGPFAEHNTGFQASRVVAFDTLPGAPSVLFAARSDGPSEDSVHYSTDAGATWKRLGRQPALGKVQLLRAQDRPVNQLVVVADNGWWSVRPGGEWVRIEAAPGRLVALEIGDPREAGGVLVAATDAGLYVAQPESPSTDGIAHAFDADGAEATATWKRLYSGRVTALALRGDRYLAAAGDTMVRGRLASADAPEPTVETAPRGGLAPEIRALTLDPGDPSRAFALAGGAVFRSDDGGARWEELTLPWPAVDLRSLTVNPDDPDQVLALDFGGAVYRGHGGGRHWLVLDDDPGLHMAWSLGVSADIPGLALVATRGHGLRVVSLVPGQRGRFGPAVAPAPGAAGGAGHGEAGARE